MTNRANSDLLKCQFFHFAFRTSHSGLPPLFFSLTEVLHLAQFWIQKTVKPPLMATSTQQLTSLQLQRPLKRVPNCQNNLSTSFFSDWRKWQEWSQNLIHMASQWVIGASLSTQLKCKYSTFLVRPFLEHVPQAESQCHITPLPPLTATTPQRSLSSVPKVAVVDRFDCIKHWPPPSQFSCTSKLCSSSNAIVKCWRNAAAMLVKLTIVNMQDD